MAASRQSVEAAEQLLLDLYGDEVRGGVRGNKSTLTYNQLIALLGARKKVHRILGGDGWESGAWAVPRDHAWLGNSQYSVEDVLRGRGGKWAELIPLLPPEFLAMPAGAPVDNKGKRVDQINGVLSSQLADTRYPGHAGKQAHDVAPQQVAPQPAAAPAGYGGIKPGLLAAIRRGQGQ